MGRFPRERRVYVETEERVGRAELDKRPGVGRETLGEDTEVQSNWRKA